MRIHVVSPPSAHPTSLIDQYRQRGDVVTHSDQIPFDADLYVFCTGHNAIKHLTRGLVVADLRHGPDLEAADWLPYADLCLVRTPSDQAALAEVQDCEPERIYVVPNDDGLLDLMDKALRDLLSPAEVAEGSRRGFLPGESKMEMTMADVQRQSAMPTMSNTPQIAALTARLNVAERQSDVMLRNYRVHSKAPLVGPLITWVRRNLTSHLREPYLDPTLERQVALNRDLVKALQEILPLLADLEARMARIEEKGHDD